MNGQPGMEKSAFLAALQAPNAGAEDALAMEGGDQLARDLVADMQEDEDPTTQDGDHFFLDPEMWPLGKWKKGQTVMVKARVESLGSKIGLTPIEVEYNNPDENGQDSDDIDPDDED